MVIPVDKNIRYRGFSLPQPIEYGIPVVQQGDWLAERTGQLVYHRQPWEADLFVRDPARPVKQLIAQAALSGMGASASGPMIDDDTLNQWKSSQANIGQPAYDPDRPPTPTQETYGPMVCQAQTRTGGTAYWRNVQQRLCNAGFDPGVIDGRVGPNTRGAIERYQTARGLSSTGRVTGATASALGVTTEPAGGGGGGASITGGDKNGSGGGGVDTRGNGSNLSTILSNFFSWRNPTMWLSMAGSLALIGGLIYYSKVSKKSKRKIPKTLKRKIPKTRKQNPKTARLPGVDRPGAYVRKYAVVCQDSGKVLAKVDGVAFTQVVDWIKSELGEGNYIIFSPEVDTAAGPIGVEVYRLGSGLRRSMYNFRGKDAEAAAALAPRGYKRSKNPMSKYGDYILARISDNVLDKKDWTVLQLKIVNGRVRSQTTKHAGAYSAKLVGKTLEDLARWTEHDDTGRYPETYNEIEVSDGFGRTKWRTFVSVDDLERDLGRYEWF